MSPLSNSIFPGLLLLHRRGKAHNSCCLRWSLRRDTRQTSNGGSYQMRTRSCLRVSTSVRCTGWICSEMLWGGTAGCIIYKLYPKPISLSGHTKNCHFTTQWWENSPSPSISHYLFFFHNSLHSFWFSKNYICWRGEWVMIPIKTGIKFLSGVRYEWF